MSRISLTVVSPDWSDDRGASVPDWGKPIETDEEGWLIQPMSAVELTAAGRQGVVTALKGFGPADSVITEHDRVVIDEITYEVDGSVEHYASITGRLAHVEVILKRVEG